jgi:hypothetical protein
VDVDDWEFGLTRRDRCPKPALAAVRAAFAEVPFPPNLPWPKISVVICTYNGAHVIRDCLASLRQLDYPNFEVIVVNDGSTDATAAIVQEYDVRLINTEQRGLSRARNTGMEATTGEIIAYTDDDAYPDPHWLTYLAATFMGTSHAGVGGPNIAPPDDGFIADCVANAPGSPTHVLLTDQEAEHIPGCNMAVRKSDLEAIGGFDPQYRTAGDDVACVGACGSRVDAGVQPGGGGVASSPKIGACLLGAAMRLRPGRGAARSEVAGQVQRRRSSHLGRTSLWHGAQAHLGARGANLSRCGAVRLFNPCMDPPRTCWKRCP